MAKNITQTKISNRDTQIPHLLKKELEATFENDIFNIILFGSRSIGKASKNSDYDIHLVLKLLNYDWKLKDEIIDEIYDIELENDVLFDLHVISDYEINNSLRGKQNIIQNALSKGYYV